MSALISGLIRNLVVIIFLNLLLEMMLPRGEFHRYIRLVTGLIVILMVVGTMSVLVRRVPELEPALAAPFAGAGGGAAAAEQVEKAGEAYRRQVLQQCRAALEVQLRKEIAAWGEWELAEAAIVLEEDYNSGSFGEPLQLSLVVKKAAHRGKVAPVHIEPVVVGEPGAEDGGSGTAGRLPELERYLAALLQLSPEQVTGPAGE